jgi:uncharacterized protein YndB with AHSA1/START domain
VPSFEDSAVSQAPPEEVWKLLYDPARFPEWWAGIEAVDAGESDDPDRRPFSYYAEGKPALPMPQLLNTSRAEHRILISCLVTDLRFEWRLEPADGGRATLIRVFVDIPEQQTGLLETERTMIRRSLARLAALAADA